MPETEHQTHHDNPTTGKVADAPGAKALALKGGAVEFENVTFGYDAGRSVLKNVSFRAAPGATVALVGATGSGKSTLTRLLFRFFDVTEGAVRVDGQDVRTVTQASLRAAIGMVPQDCVLFNGEMEGKMEGGRGVLYSSLLAGWTGGRKRAAPARACLMCCLFCAADKHQQQQLHLIIINNMNTIQTNLKRPQTRSATTSRTGAPARPTPTSRRRRARRASTRRSPRASLRATTPSSASAGCGCRAARSSASRLRAR